jgi:non-homologous end joining protein Ku
MKFDLSMSDYTIILNALHYYKKVEKRAGFTSVTDEQINAIRDSMAKQLVDDAWGENLPSWRE